jgi:hypothetical protein
LADFFNSASIIGLFLLAINPSNLLRKLLTPLLNNRLAGSVAFTKVAREELAKVRL